MQSALDLDDDRFTPEPAPVAVDPFAPEAGNSSGDGVIGAPFRLATLDAIESDIVAVASAIEALDDGTYGRCGFCGSEIAADALTADPLTTRCDAHR